MQLFHFIKRFVSNIFTSWKDMGKVNSENLTIFPKSNDIISFNFFIPKEFVNNFEIKKITEGEEDRYMDIIEKESCIPKELRNKEVVLNGYCNPVTILDFPFRGKRVNLKFYRRRWKEKGKRKSYNNSYEFHLKWIKTTKEFGFFLKEFPRYTYNGFFKFRLVPENIMKKIVSSV